jgi:hypothetical protein
MDPTEHEQDPARRPSRRKRALLLVLAAAAIAIPSVAIAGGGGSSGSLSPAPADDDIPSIWTQDEDRSDGKRFERDGRDCPFKHRNRGTDAADERDL